MIIYFYWGVGEPAKLLKLVNETHSGACEPAKLPKLANETYSGASEPAELSNETLHIQELVNLLEEASNYNNYNKKQKDKPGVSGYFKVGYLVVRPSVIRVYDL